MVLTIRMQGDNISTMILKSAEIYILPGADLDNFDMKKKGKCYYDDIKIMGAWFFGENCDTFLKYPLKKSRTLYLPC